MKVAIFQTDIHWNSPRQNHDKLSSAVSLLKGQQVDLAIFPEMFNTGFSFLNGESAREAATLGAEFLQQSAVSLNCSCVASMPYSPDGEYALPFNTLRVFGPQGFIADYQKVHLFTFGGEATKCRAGNQPPLNLKIAEFRVSFAICYDLRFPSHFSPMAKNTDLFVVIANWPEPRKHHWRNFCLSRAVENQAFLIGVNRVGQGGGLNYAGGSIVVSPTGDVLAECSDQQEVKTCTLDLDAVRKYREAFSCLADRREDVYLKMR